MPAEIILDKTAANEKTDWQTYLLRCADHSLYCGITKNIDARLLKHNQGKASKYTRSRLPAELVAVRNNLTRSQALKFECRIKRLPANKKIFTLNNGTPEK